MSKKKHTTVSGRREEWLSEWLRGEGYIGADEDPRDACYYELDFRELLKLVAHARAEDFDE